MGDNKENKENNDIDDETFHEKINYKNRNVFDAFKNAGSGILVAAQDERNIRAQFALIIIALILGIFKEMILLLLFFNILRATGFGLHAKKSWECLISSTIIFIFLPFIATYVTIPAYIKCALGILAIILVYIYSPADTEKRPIISKIRRDKYKFITTINCILLVFIMIFINNEVISNLILFAVYTEITMIIPLTYKMFNLGYKNYLTYQMN